MSYNGLGHPSAVGRTRHRNHTRLGTFDYPGVPTLVCEGLEGRGRASQASHPPRPPQSRCLVTVCGTQSSRASFFFPAPACHMPQVCISLKETDLEPCLQWCRVARPDSCTTMERILRYFGTKNRKRTVIAYSGSLHTESKAPMARIPWNK